MRQLPSVSYSLIGKYRAELMGIAILNVLVLHSLSWTGFNSPGWGAILLTTFGRLVFTEGFLFLSGFGLYYSLHKSYDLRLFFTKRIQRLLIPYWLMSLPFFVIWLVGGRFGISGLLMRLSTLEFWFHGNYVGMWYISLSVLLYAFMPLMFRGIRWWGGLVLIAISAITVLYLLVPEYYNMTSIGIANVPFFIFGAWSGKQSIEGRGINVLWLAGLLVLLAILYICSVSVCIWLPVREWVFRLVGMIVCCLLMKWTEKRYWLHHILRWIGSYTLELYIFHLMIYASLSAEFHNGYVRTALSIVGAFLLCVPAQIICKKVAGGICQSK